MAIFNIISEELKDEDLTLAVIEVRLGNSNITLAQFEYNDSQL